MVKKEFSTVDIFKFFCAVLVIAIHTKPFINYFWLDAGVGLITRFAVPYFFCVSAYFLFAKLNRIDKVEEKLKIVGDFLLRLLRLYAVWYIIYTVINIINGEIYSAVEYLKQFFLPTDGNLLWFLSALIYGVILVFLLSLILRQKTVLIISCVALLFGYMLSTLGVLFEGSAIYIWINNYILSYIGLQNGLFFAFPYVALAYICAGKHFDQKNKRDIIVLLALFILLGAESIIAVVLIQSKLTFLWLSALPLTYFTFRMTLMNSIPWKLDYLLIRKISTVMYVSHFLIIKTLESIFTAISFSDQTNLSLFVLTVMFVLLFSFSIVKVSRIKAFGWFKYFM